MFKSTQMKRCAAGIIVLSIIACVLAKPHGLRAADGPGAAAAADFANESRWTTLWATDATLQDQVETLGFTVKPGNNNSCSVEYQRPGWTFSVTICLSKDNTLIWMISYLGPISADVPADRLIKLLAANRDIAPGEFWIVHDKDTNKDSLEMARAVINRGAKTAMCLKAFVDQCDTIVSTQGLWDQSKWAADSHIQPVIPDHPQ